MTKEDLALALDRHLKWLRNEVGGVRANLSDANLGDANLGDADLSDANLRGADLSRANLSGANLSGANLGDADLCGADLRAANLRAADLSDANLSGADLRAANLSGANLSGANLCGAKNLPSAAEWLRANTKTTKRGCILAYKAIGGTTYPPRADWVIAQGSYLTEVVNPCRGTDCGCGVNVGTLDFVLRNCRSSDSVWLVGIEPADLADVVVPFRTDGKFRAARVRLIRPLTDAERKRS